MGRLGRRPQLPLIRGGVPLFLGRVIRKTRARMALENRSWGYTRIQGDVRLLGVSARLDGVQDSIFQCARLHDE